MKITRYKKVHKYLSFFKNNYGFRKPYQILIDGTFCFAALKHKVNIREQLPKYLDDEVKLLTTPCAVIETETLGKFGAMFIVKQFGIHKCGHDSKPVPAAECLLSMIGKSNPNRYILATQDRDLQASAQNIPGTPLIYLHDQTPTLQPPSEISVQTAETKNRTLYDVRKDEEERLKSLKRKHGMEEVEEQPIRKRKKRKGPNPLSCKKKKKKPTQQNTASKEMKRKRKRKRVRISKHIKDMISQT